MPVGRAPHARRAQPAGGPVAGGQARGLGAGSRGTSRPCPSPRQPWWDQLQWAHHTGSCYLGTVPKGRVAAVEETTREVALDSVPAAGHGAAGLGPCTPPGCPPHSCPDGGGGGGKPEPSRRGVRRGHSATGQKPASQHPLFKLWLGMGVTSSPEVANLTHDTFGKRLLGPEPKGNEHRPPHGPVRNTCWCPPTGGRASPGRPARATG